MSMPSSLTALAVLAGTVAASLPEAFCTSEDGQYKLSALTVPVLNDTSEQFGADSTWSLSVDDTSSGYKQRITGFGAAVTDATVAVFGALNDSMLDTLLSELLTTRASDAAVGFRLFRHTIASSDLSADPAYTYDDNDNRSDAQLSGFHLGDRGTAMAQLLARMQARQSDIELLGSPWAPPAWTQTDGQLIGGSGSTDDNRLDMNSTSVRHGWAQYFVRYLQAYKAAGVRVGALTIQNEPLNSRAGMPTLYVPADDAGVLIRDHLGPALQAAGLGNTEIWAYDHNTDEPAYPETVLAAVANTTVEAMVTAVAWHCYASQLDWTVLSTFHEAHPDARQYMTECYTPTTGAWSWPVDFTMGPLQNWAAGVVAWTLAADQKDGPHLNSSAACSTCAGLVTVDTDTGSYELQPAYYLMGQFSRFMPAGAVVLTGTGSYTYGSGAGIESVASLNPDGSRTVVIKNTFGNSIAVTVAMASSGNEWTGLVPANSVVTWVLSG
ncbi:O-glycosyl hydrolase [Grosmannia clavigera kw1407]|uniref:O-glycosyl hydrolase n=1 Tax=Grosmannia clavigera (strain kw1407 / UAMH 11150) TaxID=655863 RepID=F0XP82_GROCL|nr:O-glycosyl hydrolase [Grosmannia clavigera kw1407]EFX00566.1 O-glycosyl hydrolase [Grosmannia clavigera kw1407]